MDIYLVLLIVVIICCFAEVNIDVLKIGRFRIRMRNLSFFIVFLFILLLGILRYELLGVDVRNYRNYFYAYGRYQIKDILSEITRDNGYMLLNKLVSLLTNEYWVYKGILYTITFGIYSVVVYRKSRYPAMSFLIYLGLGFLGFNFCILRQALAVSVCFYSFQYIKDKKPVRFVEFVLLAATIHKTAVFYLLLYPIANDTVKNISLFKKICLVIASIFGAIFILPYLYQMYRIDYSETSTAGEGYEMLLFYIVVIIGIVYLIKKTNSRSYFATEENAAVAVIYFQIVALFFSLFTRMTSYFSLMITTLLPNVIEKCKNKNWITLITVIIFSFMYFWKVYMTAGEGILPYLSQFSS